MRAGRAVKQTAAGGGRAAGIILVLVSCLYMVLEDLVAVVKREGVRSGRDMDP